MEQEKSKSQIKREAKALQDLGVSLTQLTPSQLAKVPAPEELLEAIIQFKKITSNVAKKRHIQFIGKVMRKIENIDEIQKAYDQITKGIELNTQNFHLMEDWRSRLLSDDKQALTEFMHQYPCDNAQQLRQLIRKAKSERDQQKNLGANKALFQFIKNLIN